MNAVFITATGTDIGKTFVAAGLIRHFRQASRAVDALKPVATGFDAAAAVSSDPGVLLKALGRTLDASGFERVSPWRFSAPLSPDMAAQKENRTLDFNELVAFCSNAVEQSAGTLLIEGIGGVMVPLDERSTVLDWITALKVPVLLVTGSYLGTLSHTLTALTALRQRAAAIKAIVVNETPGSTVTMPDTMATLSRFTAPVPLVALPRAPDRHARIFAEIADLL